MYYTMSLTDQVSWNCGKANSGLTNISQQLSQTGI